jgi:uncharacterized membrane protein
VHLGLFVVERDGGEVDRGDLTRAAHRGVDDLALGARAVQRLGRAIELALLGLRALQQHEHALVLDRAHGVAARLFEQLGLVR